jgi:uncharacterized repeat protein (TIGR03803 family)
MERSCLSLGSVFVALARVLFWALVVGNPAARADVAGITVLHQFGTNPGGFEPAGPLIQGANGSFYGVAAMGGANATGTIFSITPGGPVTTLYNFGALDVNDLNSDGASPNTLVQGGDGNFYGTTSSGGADGYGTIFQLTPTGTLTVLHAFVGTTDGNTPTAFLQGSDGDFYGTMQFGGAHGDGLIYAITPGGLLTTLYSFTNGTDGGNPVALIEDAHGNFYGRTADGMATFYSTVFQLTAKGVLTTLHSFVTGLESLILGTDGKLYATAVATDDNGDIEHGYVYSITTAGVVRTLYQSGIKQAYPASLIQGSDGNFYLTAVNPSIPDVPYQVDKLTPAGVLTKLLTLTGNRVINPLLQGRDGDIYGTTQPGGADGPSIVFSVTPTGGLHVLTKFAPSGGAAPMAGLVQGVDGNLYGTTSQDAGKGAGTVFQITPAGVLTVLHYFSTPGNSIPSTNADGAYPGVLVAGQDGNFYGLTSGGGAVGYGTFYRITPGGTLTTLHSFSSAFGGASSLMQGSDGNFYATVTVGNAKEGAHGTIFSLTPAGLLTTLHFFTGGADGASPMALTEGSPGTFYGTSGDYEHAETVFKVTSAGVFTTLYTFTGLPFENGAYSGLTMGADGNFYGIGGNSVFVVTPAGMLTKLYDEPFPGTTVSSFIQGPDGNFYGNTGEGLIQVTPTGTVNRLYTFAGNEGGSSAPLLLGKDGNLYGTTPGAYNYGTPPITTYGTVFQIPFTAVANSALITSSEQFTIGVGLPFRYQITTNHPATSYAAIGLSGGLRLNPATGLITGEVPAATQLTNLKYTAIAITVQTTAGTATGALNLDVVPVVNVRTMTPDVGIGGGQSGVFHLNLNAAQNPFVSTLVVHYTFTGSAINGTDYMPLKGTKRFPAGFLRKTIDVVPKGNLDGAASKSVRITLEPGAGYVLGHNTTAEIELLGAGQ